MTPFLLRQFWSVVEATQTNLLLSLDDTSLNQWLLRQLQAKGSLNHDETNILNHYIRSKLSLIRDIAQDRQPVYQGTH